MTVPDILRLMQPIDWLTVGLLVFAGAQVWVQARSERQRRLERRLDNDELIDRAFHYVWTEHFRLEGLADELDRRDLIEMSFLGVLKPEDVLPRDWSKLTESMSSLSREAGFLGAVAIGLCHDVERSMAILVTSVVNFAEAGPRELDPLQKVELLRNSYDEELAPWVAAVRKGVRELANLVWDAAKHNPRMTTVRRLEFSEDLSSDFAKAAVKGLLRRSSEQSPAPTQSAKGRSEPKGAV